MDSIDAIIISLENNPDYLNKMPFVVMNGNKYLSVFLFVAFAGVFIFMLIALGDRMPTINKIVTYFFVFPGIILMAWVKHKAGNLVISADQTGIYYKIKNEEKAALLSWQIIESVEILGIDCLGRLDAKDVYIIMAEDINFPPLRNGCPLKYRGFNRKLSFGVNTAMKVSVIMAELHKLGYKSKGS